MAVNKNFVVKNGLEVDTNLIFADATNKRVGIASTTPNYTLNVAGGIGATDLYISGVSTFIGIGTFSSDVYVDGNLNVVGDITYDEVTGRNLKITGLSTFEGNSYFGSSVGIGTTNPDSALHIQSPSSSTTLTLTAPSAQPNKIQFQTYAGTLDAQIKNESSGLIFSTGSTPTTRYGIDSAGKHTFGSGSTNVQIGNAGDVWVENALYVGDSASPTITLHNAGSATFTGSQQIGGEADANPCVAGIKAHPGGEINVTAATAISNLWKGRLVGSQTVTSSIKADGSAVFSKLGIGTESPQESLQIHSTTIGGAVLEISENSTVGGDTWSSLFQMRGNDLEIRGSSGQMEFYTGSADGASSTERMRLSNIGELNLGSFRVGQAGVVTATSYYGDGSTLTNAGTSLGMVIALSG